MIEGIYKLDRQYNYTVLYIRRGKSSVTVRIQYAIIVLLYVI